MGKAEDGDLRFGDGRGWRRWLERNHDTSDGVWLILRKKGADIQGVTYEEALDEALCLRVDRQQARADRRRDTPAEVHSPAPREHLVQGQCETGRAAHR